MLSISNTLAEDGESKQRLDDVRNEIKDLNAELNRRKVSREEIYAQLKTQSLKVSELNRELRSLQQQIAEKNQALNQLRDIAGIKKSEQEQQLEALYKQIRSAYINFKPNYLAMLLSQEDTAAISRGSDYFRYFHEARRAELENINQALMKLNNEHREILLVQQSLEAAKKDQHLKHQALLQETDKRMATLADLDKTISSQDAKLATLQEEENNLQILLDSLAHKPEKEIFEENSIQQKPTTQSNSAAIATPAKPDTPFSRLNGKLDWPVIGKLLAHYGSPRNIGKLKWQGIIIDSPIGNDVRAPANGRVVFSDWLRGFGLLIIVDHGEQYMTLYGNNESLLKQAGDTVETGEIIAQSGEQGIRGLTGLYFEIRHRGTPTDPLKWLARQG